MADCLADVVRGAARWVVVPCDNRFGMGGLPDACVDAVVCDPPYELGFMGRRWDASGIAFDVAMWREVLRVSKPGAHLVAFGGTRTYHRMACAIEDAGWDIRDSLCWLYGSGFPKSLDVSKAIDKALGAERPIMGTYKSQLPGGSTLAQDAWSVAHRANGERGNITAAATAAATAAEGYGTALKPAWESIILAQKPLELSQLVHTIGSWLQTLCVRLAGLSSESKRVALARLDSARRSAGRPFATPAASSEATVTSPCGSATSSNWSTVSSWRATLDAISELASTCTIETESSLTTDLRILNSLLSMLTPESITADLMSGHGTPQRAALVAEHFAAAESRRALIQTRSVLDAATSLELENYPDGAEPSLSTIVLARKPLTSTVAANFMEYGTGALNIDGCRIEWAGEEDKAAAAAAAAAAAQRACLDQNANRTGYGDFNNGPASLAPYLDKMGQGRWPANVLLDEDAAEVLDAQTGDRPSGIAVTRNGGGRRIWGSDNTNGPVPDSGYTDGGGPSRFFYTAKASRSERDAGLEEFDPSSAAEATSSKDGQSRLDSPRTGAGRTGGARNTHPTVKPIDVMRWLVRLVSRPGALILDPFCGSGSTGIATMLEGDGRRFIGMELDPKHVDFARARIAHVVGGTWQREVTKPSVELPRQPSLFGGT